MLRSIVRAVPRTQQRGFSAVAGPATKVTTLPNGVRVATEEGHGETATVGVFIDAGSRYETAQNNGVAHFLEHLAFKGTSKRSRVQLEKEVEDIGGHLNAYTSREQTVYYAKVFKNDVPQAVDILADILQNSKLDPSDIELERDTILREMQEVESHTEEVIFDRLHSTAFRDNSLGRTILGPVENISRLSRDDLSEYVKNHYTADKMVIAAAGAVKHEQLVELATKLFAGLPTKAAKPSILEPAHFVGSDIRTRDDDMGEAHVAIAFRGAEWKSADSIPLLVLQSHLGSWDQNTSGGKNSHSRLAVNAAENHLAHKYSSFSTQYRDTGLFGVYFVADPRTVNDMSFNVMHEIVRVAHKITPEEVERAKQHLKGSILMNLDGTSAVAEDIGRQLLTYGRRVSPAETVARIDAVNVDTLKGVVNKYVYDKELAVASMGAVWELPDYNWFRRRTYWLRY